MGRHTDGPQARGGPRRAAAIAVAALLAGLCTATAAQQAAPDAATTARIERAAADMAAELATRCPLAPAGDVAAYTACRQGLFGASALRSQLMPIVLWGRQSKTPGASLRQTNLTQFAPDVWTSMYAPLFMFNGRHAVQWVPEEKMYLVRLQAAFRNRLPPGQFPYPFWHEEAKWSTYENATTFMLWIAPDTGRIRAAQFTDRGDSPLLQPVQAVRHAPHDGKWLWTDEQGHTQPAVTLFDGVYQAGNPYLKPLDRQYRDLALQLRESQCVNCHVPNNPDKMSRLVLLSTPAHAAGEIDRLIKSVREDRMPMDEFRSSYALPDETKKALLERAETFRATVQAARQWELQARAGAGGAQTLSSTNPQQVTK